MGWNPDTITSERFRQLCDLNVPYNGYVDDGLGTVLYINEMYMDVNENRQGDVVNYSKSISILVSEVTHTIKKGDNLSSIARKLGVTVDQIVQDNNIVNPGTIYAGDVLKIKTDIQYGYGVSSSVYLPAFNPEDSKYYPISESAFYEGLDRANSFAGSLAYSLKNNAGRSTVGNNGQFYWEKPSGRAFYGNQYVKTYSLRNIGRVAGNITTPVAIMLEGVEVYDGVMQDGGIFGHNAQKQLAGGMGSIGGALAGGYFGMKLGSTIGVFFGGVGAIPGAIIGGFIGGLIGGILGSNVCETAAEAAYDAVVLLNTEIQTAR